MAFEVSSESATDETSSSMSEDDDDDDLEASFYTDSEYSKKGGR